MILNDLKNSGEIKLRKACLEDLNAVMNMIENAIETMNKNGIMQWDSLYPDREILKEDILKGEMILGEVENSIAAIVVVNQEFDEEYEKAQWKHKDSSYVVVHRLCVNPQLQNKGLGTKIMTLIEKLLREKGIKTIRLDAFSLNPYALKMYEKLGYIKVGKANWRKGLFYLYEKEIILH